MSSLPKQRPRRLTCFAFLPSMILVSLIVACASGPRVRHVHEYVLAPGQEHQPSLSKALLLPIGSTDSEPVKGFDVANDRIATLVAAHLESKGISVERVDPKQFDRVSTAVRNEISEQRKKAAFGVVSTKVQMGDLIPELLERLGSNADLVIAADVVDRHAVHEGRMIVWDGVQRSQEIKGRGWMIGSGALVASIRAQVFTKNGERPFTGFGGLEALRRVDVHRHKAIVREDFLKEERNLKEGICVAFYPYFGLEEYCTR